MFCLYQETFEKRSLSRWFLATILLTFSFLSGCEQESGSATSEDSAPTVPKVEFYTVRSEEVPLIKEEPGRTASFNSAEVRPQVSGIILKRKFDEGTLVKDGQELYEIDSSVYQANFDKATANVKNLENNMNRAKRLQGSRAMSVEEYEDALFAWERAKADLELARLDLVYCQVKAPLSGRIGLSSITEGALVTNGQPEALAVIEQVDPIYVDLKPAVPHLLDQETSEGTSGGAKLPFWQNAKVKLVLENGAEYNQIGRIKVLDNHVDADTGTITLRAEFPNPDETLLPGMFVRAFVEEGIRQDGHLIPQEALCRDMKGKPYVWVIGSDNKVEVRNIETSRTIGNSWLVDSGLETGERIVVEGLLYLTPNGEVEPIQSEKDAL